MTARAETLAAAGRLDWSTAPAFEAAAVRLLEGCRRLVLDLTDLREVSPSGAGSLAAVVERAAARGVEVAVRGPLPAGLRLGGRA